MKMLGPHMIMLRAPEHGSSINNLRKNLNNFAALCYTGQIDIKKISLGKIFGSFHHCTFKNKTAKKPWCPLTGLQPVPEANLYLFVFRVKQLVSFKKAVQKHVFQ